MVDGRLQPLAGAQAIATSPGDHVWLSASAGTGKTHVLTARVYRLLLAGVPPENILCLTFTKAGAAEMAERIHDRLARWVQMDGPALAADLHALGEDVGPERQDRARRLFAEVLEATGGGLRIQTIHGFCQQLLSAFPVEAGLVPGFRPLEAREQQVLAREALAEMVVEAEERRDEALIAAIQTLSLRLGEAGAESFLIRAARGHDVITALPQDIRGWLFDLLELPPGDVEAEIAAQCGDALFDMASLARIGAANVAWGTKTALEDLDHIAAWRAADPAGRAASLEELLKVFRTARGEPRKFSQKLVDADPGYADIATRLGDRCKDLLQLRARAAYAEMLAQALYAGRAYAAAYAQAKRNAGAVDFDDLIARAATLLSEGGMGDWIRYKLDQQVDHVLIDEAQDTNRRQWEIVEAIAQEFFAGEGARGDTLRTIFTVGDFKQAIFGFQGTSPREFERARRRFGLFAEFAGHAFHSLSLDRSFRSTPAVLEVVDATVATLAPEALGLEPVQVRHLSANPRPGEVLLWKPVSLIAPDDEDAGEVAAAEEAGGEENWNAEHVRILAQRIADQIGEWIDGGLMLESKGRPIRPGDIMILVRSRTELARLIVARLYEADVPVAGIDRLRLNAPLAVRDLLAALRFAVQPEDDLNLAGLLVSPLVGWSQDDLMHRAAGRKEGLWRHLRATVADAALAPLHDLLRIADFTTPYRYLEHILSGVTDGRRKLIARLGTEVRDPIEELLNAALAFEADGAPSLQRFIDWFDRGDVEIVRDAAAQGNAVRLLTVHGSKGLQAPVVILADAAHDPDAGNRTDSLEWEGLPIVPPRKSERFGPVGDAMQAAAVEEREEHWRLLYVAMTRAEERLVVAGALGPRAKGVVPEASWHAAVEQGMAALGAQWEADPLWGARRRWIGRETMKPVPVRPAAPDVRERVEEPAWLRQPAPTEARPPRPLAPSVQPEDDTPDPPPGPAMRAAAERGKLMHALFERLPAVAPAERRAAALRWLGQSMGADDALAEDVAAHVLRVIDAPDFAALFSPEALAEAPIAAVVGEDVIAGTVDRLRVGERLVQAVDFKTGRHVPASADAVPLPHLRQMAAYAAALAVIFPDREIEAALLYTAGPSLIRLPDALLAPHKPGLGTAQHNLSAPGVEPDALPS
jgi:ATP-dependent helicase/nuclease subunit A